MAVKGVAMMGDGRRWHGHTPWILSLQRNVAVLALRLLDPLGLEHAQSLDQLGAGFPRLDHLRDVAAPRFREGVGGVGFFVLGPLLAAVGAGAPSGDVLSVADAERP